MNEISVAMKIKQTTGTCTCRVNASIKYRLDKDFCILYGSERPKNPSCADSGTAVQVPFPDRGWEIIRAFPSTSRVPQFNTGHIVAKFVPQTMPDNLSAADFKSVKKSVEDLFCCGHVQAIEVRSTDEYLFMKANYIPEMRKDRGYTMFVWPCVNLVMM